MAQNKIPVPEGYKAVTFYFTDLLCPEEELWDDDDPEPLKYETIEEFSAAVVQAVNSCNAQIVCVNVDRYDGLWMDAIRPLTEQEKIYEAKKKEQAAKAALQKKERAAKQKAAKEAKEIAELKKLAAKYPTVIGYEINT